MKEENDQKNWDSYFFEGTDILKNNFDILDKNDLKKKEVEVCKQTLTLEYLKPTQGNFDIEHLKKVHKNIFSKIYPFAGQLRTCSMYKDDHVFCNPDEIENRLKETLYNMNKDFESNIGSKQEFAFKLADYYFEVISIHPFREGNGRSIRSFFRNFVLEKSKNFDFGPLDLDYTKIDKEKLMLGTAQRYLFMSLIEMEFFNGLVEIEKEDIKTK